MLYFGRFLVLRFESLTRALGGTFVYRAAIGRTHSKQLSKHFIDIRLARSQVDMFPLGRLRKRLSKVRAYVSWQGISDG